MIRRGLVLLVALAAAGLHAGTVSVNIDVTAGRHTINSNIYGVAFATADELRELNVPLNRWGGNTTSRYNWQLSASNHGSDYFYESIPDDPDADKFIQLTQEQGAQPMITIPMTGWVARLGTNRANLASFSVRKYGQQQQTDPFMPDAGNGVSVTGALIGGNDPKDANVQVDSTFQQAFVAHIVSKWGGVRYYLLDNEPSLWWQTHRDVAPKGLTMQETADRMIDYAAHIKAAQSNAIVAGPEEWGWLGYLYSGSDQQVGLSNGYTNFPDRASHGGSDSIPWVLSRIRQEEKTRGTRLLDAVSVHYYPQGGEFSDDVSTNMQLLRNRSTRSLWDPNYVDQSWINDKVQLIPRLRGWAENFHTGTPIGITEYNWGAEGSINGATAQADVLGIFGRENVDFAARWGTPDPASPVYKAILMYRNYDGHDGTFGDVSVSTTTPDPDVLAAFGALRSSDQSLTIMVINKALTDTTTVNFQIAGFPIGGVAQRWQLTSTNRIQRVDDAGLAAPVVLPPQSITLLVLSAKAPALRGRTVRH